MITRILLLRCLGSFTILSLFVGSCSSGAPTPDALSPTPTGQDQMEPTVTAGPSPTIPPELAPPSPEPTFTPGPSATPLPTPEGQIGPLVYPPGVNSLTGLLAPDPTSLDRRPLAVKISNFPVCVRPQSGLSAADLVFEHLAEGGTTRFTAIFYGNNPGTVGSVRSARFLDLEIPAMYQSLLAFSGASVGVLALLDGADFRPFALSPEFGVRAPAFYRLPLEQTPCGIAGTPLLEHSLFANTRDLWAYAASQGINKRPALTGMTFNGQPPAGGQPGTLLTVPYSASYVTWIYDPNLGLYFRGQDGGSHVDANTKLTITAANVAVIFAPHVITDIREDSVGYNPTTGQGGNYSAQIQMWNTGPAILFRDGQAYQGTWTRFGRNDPLAIVFSADQYVPFRPGNTWFEVVPLDSAISTEGRNWNVKPTKLPKTPFGP